MPHAPTRRSFLLGAAGAATAAALAACGSDEDAPAGASRTTSGAATASAVFPLAIRDRFGSTTISARPERVVCYGYNDHDTLLALGVVPTGLIHWIPEWERGVGPWSLEALGENRPELFDGVEVPFERIAALKPDLILAVNHELARRDRDRLAEIAPVVSTPPGHPPYGLPPSVQALQVGTAIGLERETQALVDRLEGTYAAARRRHPAFAGKTSMVVSPFEGQMSVFADTDSRGRLVGQLGFRQPAEIAGIVGDDFYAYISPERVDLLEVDALIVLAYDAAARSSLEKMATYQQLDVVRRGSAVVVDDMDTAMALSAGTVTSIPYALGGVVPQIAAATVKAA